MKGELAMSPEKVIKGAGRNSSFVAGSITKKQIVEARAEAQRILAAAERTAAAIRESAETFAREEREAAYRAGYEAALLEWTNLLLEARELRDNALAGIEQDVLRLSVKIAEKIIGNEIKADPQTLAEIVAKALRNVRRNELVTIRVNPADASTVEGHREKLDPAGRARFLEVVADPRVTKGGCLIETESGAVDAQLETQLRVLERALLRRVSVEGQ
jgi:type III secretion protein L